MTQLRKPSALLPGDPIAVVAPGSVPEDSQALATGIARIESAGHPVIQYRPLLEPYGYLAGSDDDRAKELNTVFENADVRTAVAVRGGYGCLRLLDALNFDAARELPTLLIGYSDITAVQLALLARADVPSLSGPMVAVEWALPHFGGEEIFWAIARGEVVSDLHLPGTPRPTAARIGNGEGRLVGGNLSVLCRLVGTPFLPDLRGAILFLEDVGEPPYRVDGLFAQLKLAGILNAVSGLVLGDFAVTEPIRDRPTLTLQQVLENYVSDLTCPVATGFRYGHFADKVPLPIGTAARLDVSEEAIRLSMLEPLVDVTT